MELVKAESQGTKEQRQETRAVANKLLMTIEELDLMRQPVKEAAAHISQIQQDVLVSSDALEQTKSGMLWRVNFIRPFAKQNTKIAFTFLLFSYNMSDYSNYNLGGGSDLVRYMKISNNHCNATHVIDFFPSDFRAARSKKSWTKSVVSSHLPMLKNWST